MCCSVAVRLIAMVPTAAAATAAASLLRYLSIDLPVSHCSVAHCERGVHMQHVCKLQWQGNVAFGQGQQHAVRCRPSALRLPRPTLLGMPMRAGSTPLHQRKSQPKHGSASDTRLHVVMLSLFQAHSAHLYLQGRSGRGRGLPLGPPT